MFALENVNVSLCTANCPTCRILTDFLMFESGAGGDFETYVGNATGTLYRLDMTGVMYLGKTVSGLLAPAIEREGGVDNLRKIPEQVRCKSCGSVFAADQCRIETDIVAPAQLLA